MRWYLCRVISIWVLCDYGWWLCYYYVMMLCVVDYVNVIIMWLCCYVLSNVRAVCYDCMFIVWLWHCCVIIMWALRNAYVSHVWLLWYSDGNMLLLCEYYVHSDGSLCHYCCITVLVVCGYCVSMDWLVCDD